MKNYLAMLWAVSKMVSNYLHILVWLVLCNPLSLNNRLLLNRIWQHWMGVVSVTRLQKTLLSVLLADFIAFLSLMKQATTMERPLWQENVGCLWQATNEEPNSFVLACGKPNAANNYWVNMEAYPSPVKPSEDTIDPGLIPWFQPCERPQNVRPS